MWHETDLPRGLTAAILDLCKWRICQIIIKVIPLGSLCLKTPSKHFRLFKNPFEKPRYLNYSIFIRTMAAILVLCKFWKMPKCDRVSSSGFLLCMVSVTQINPKTLYILHFQVKLVGCWTKRNRETDKQKYFFIEICIDCMYVSCAI